MYRVARILAAGVFSSWVTVALGQSPDHIVVGQSPPGGTPLQLYTDATLPGASGHGPSIPPGAILAFNRIPLVSAYAQPRFGGYSFATSGSLNVGLDYAAIGSGHELDLSLLPGPPPNFSVRLQRLSYSRPNDTALYNEFGSPRLIEDGDEYAFGDAFNGGHVHPLFLFRRPGQTQISVRFTSDQWLASTPVSYTATTVPGRAALVPLDLSGLFNADVVDSDLADSPLPFDSAGHSFILNGLYGTSAGLPADGQLAGFQLGGPGGTRLAGAATNALLDDGTRSSAATLDLLAGGQADAYLAAEFLVAGAGAFSAADVLNVTLRYTDNSTRTIAIRLASSADYLPFRPIDDWQLPVTPRPWTAVGRNGDRVDGFARSTGAGLDAPAGNNTFFFRAGTPVDSTRTLKEIQFADFAGPNRVGVFAILALKKAPLAIVTSTLPDAIEGVPYAAAVLAEGTPPYTHWSATGLPNGLSLDSDTGAITGTPAPGTAAGAPFAVQVSVQDSIHDWDASYPAENAMRTLPLSFSPIPGDIDGDGDVDAADADLLVRVLVGRETSPLFITRSDLNGSGHADGSDVQPFVDRLIPH
ncbi:MAG: Ig domain-containing protein [Phycisphaerae bacterium]